MNDRVVVTGASGFVGQALCSSLRARGMVLRPLVRAASEGDSVATAVGDIGLNTDWSAALADASAVIHCAARVHVMEESTVDSLANFRKVNVEGTRHLAQQAAAMGVRRLVYLSSIKVNGEATTPDAPFTAFSAASPEDPYSVSKWEAECGLRKVADETGLEIVIVRPPLVYGPGVRANFRRLVQAVERGLPLPFGCVNNRRSFVALENLIDLLIRCVDHTAAAGQTFLVSDDYDVSTPQLIHRISNAIGRKARLLPVPIALLRLSGRLSGKLPELERLIGSLQVDIQHTRQTLDWEPPLSFDDGLKRACSN